MTDYSTMTVSELKNIAKERNLSGYSKMKKDEIIDLISKNEINIDSEVTENLIDISETSSEEDIKNILSQYMNIPMNRHQRRRAKALARRAPKVSKRGRLV